MIDNNLEVKQWEIDDLIGAEYNPRKLSDEQKQTIKDSIKRFGLVDPVLVNTNKERKGIIIGGHQRTMIARELGFKKMPCIELDLTLEKEKELNIRLNKNTGEFDFDLLQEHFDIDNLVEFGFEDYEFGTDEEVDYSILDEDDLEDDLEEMTNGVKKAIQIEFDLEHYSEAQELFKFWRDKEVYVGAMIIDHLKSEKLKIN